MCCCSLCCAAISRLAAELPTKPQARAQLALKISVFSRCHFMASTFLPSAAKGSLGEAIIYKVFWPPFEGEVTRRVSQLFYFALAAPWFIAWWGLDRYVRMVDFFVIRGNTFELDYKSILSTISVRGVSFLWIHFALFVFSMYFPFMKHCFDFPMIY